MQSLPLFQVDAFTSKVFGGNPAAVVPCSQFPEASLMQQIATENNLSETAFVVPQGNNSFKIRWFTPNKEVRLCGHATLAAAHVLFATAPRSVETIEFQTRKAGKLVVKRLDDHQYRLDLPADEPKKISSSRILENALGIVPKAVYEGKDDLLVVVNQAKSVKQLTPDFRLLKQVKKRGVIVTAEGKKLDFVSRGFFPRFGIDEDPVTGSAHTLLTPYWSRKLNKKKLKAAQISPRRGDLACQLKGDRVRLTGFAQTYSSGKIFPDRIAFKFADRPWT